MHPILESPATAFRAGCRRGCLEAIAPDELAELITDAWRLRAPKRLQREAGL